MARYSVHRCALERASLEPARQQYISLDALQLDRLVRLLGRWRGPGVSMRYLHFARRAIGRPPSFIARRAFQEVRAEAERFLAPRRARRFDARQLLQQTDSASIDELWRKLRARPHVARVVRITPADYDSVCPGDALRI